MKDVRSERFAYCHTDDAGCAYFRPGEPPPGGKLVFLKRGPALLFNRPLSAECFGGLDPERVRVTVIIEERD